MASKYPIDAKLSAIVQQANLKREGLVADSILPTVQTPCAFKYIDWTNALTGLKITDDSVTCKSDVKMVNDIAFILKDASLKDHALEQGLGECCVTTCGDDNAYKQKIEAGKTRQLLDKLLINREKRAIDLALKKASYTDNSAKIPSASDAVVEGGWFNLPKTDVVNVNYALLAYFQDIQANLPTTGQRTLAVMDLETLNMLRRHPNFIGGGCSTEAMTSTEKVAALLGVQKIVIANAYYNNGTGVSTTMAKLWPKNHILFTTSFNAVTSEDEQIQFGFSAYSRGLKQFMRLDGGKGPTDGEWIQKQSHDFTEIILSYKSATVVQITS